MSQSKSAKTSVNILQQEELIAQKKREIEARLEQQARQNSLSIPQLPLLGEYEGIPGMPLENRAVGTGSWGGKCRCWWGRGREILILAEQGRKIPVLVGQKEESLDFNEARSFGEAEGGESRFWWFRWQKSQF